MVSANWLHLAPGFESGGLCMFACLCVANLAALACDDTTLVSLEIFHTLGPVLSSNLRQD